MLAIVIPYYKIDFFKETIESLANQTNKNFTVYIGNDASLTNPEELLATYQHKLNITYQNFTENLGSNSLVQQWYRCLALVKNEKWIFILGDDDTLDANVVSSFYENLDEIENEGISVIRFASQVIDENSNKISDIYKHPIKEKATDFLFRKFKGGTRSSLSEYVFRKDKVISIKFKDFPLAWSSDVLGVVEFSSDKAIYTINEALVFFRLSGRNITSQDYSVEKNNSWFQFYYYLLINYGKGYSNELVNMLFDKLEKVQLNNKKTPKRWLRLFWLYIVFFQYSRFFLIFVNIKKSIQ